MADIIQQVVVSSHSSTQEQYHESLRRLYLLLERCREGSHNARLVCDQLLTNMDVSEREHPEFRPTFEKMRREIAAAIVEYEHHLLTEREEDPDPPEEAASEGRRDSKQYVVGGSGNDPPPKKRRPPRAASAPPIHKTTSASEMPDPGRFLAALLASVIIWAVLTWFWIEYLRDPTF